MPKNFVEVLKIYQDKLPLNLGSQERSLFRSPRTQGALPKRLPIQLLESMTLVLLISLSPKLPNMSLHATLMANKCYIDRVSLSALGIFPLNVSCSSAE